MLIDTAEAVFQGGQGGSGVTSFGKKDHSGPDGGNGGDGGDLYVEATSDLTLLNQFSRKTLYMAGAGEHGRRNKMSGLAGTDITIFIPFGTSLIDKETGITLFELNKVGDRKLVCKGGLGGRGNWEFRGPTHQTPMFHQPGLPGEEKKLIISLKLIADFGLIGLPNSGKSSLLNELTNSNAIVANYPFTTLFPNLGVCEGRFLADIPGLIEGASDGKGLGIRFLKHIEKVEVILHCISSESSSLIKDYNTVRKELGKYSPALLKKTEIILLTKSDLIDKKKVLQNLLKLKGKSKKVLAVSIHDWESLEKLKKQLLLTV
jgi:GTP-binding protein